MNPRHEEMAWARECIAKGQKERDALEEILAADYLIRSNG